MSLDTKKYLLTVGLMWMVIPILGTIAVVFDAMEALPFMVVAAVTGLVIIFATARFLVRDDKGLY